LLAEEKRAGVPKMTQEEADEILRGLDPTKAMYREKTKSRGGWTRGSIGACGRLEWGQGNLGTNLQVLASILYMGIQECDWVINGLVTRAKSTLAASAIALGVMIAGIGGIAWLLSAGEFSSDVLAHLAEARAIAVVLALGVLGFASMLGSACLSAWALRAVRIRIPFSSNLVMSGNAMSEKALQAWDAGSEVETHRVICKSHAAALKNREGVIGSIGPKTLAGQVMLVSGLLFATAAAIVVLAVGAPAGA